jgi:hypothetical protein
MYRDAVVALAVALAVTVLTAKPSLAFGHGGGMGGRLGPATTSSLTSVTPAFSRGPVRPGNGPVPMLKNLSGRGVVKCIRACMHGVDASWAGFCEYSCAGP